LSNTHFIGSVPERITRLTTRLDIGPANSGKDLPAHANPLQHNDPLSWPTRRRPLQQILRRDTEPHQWRSLNVEEIRSWEQIGGHSDRDSAQRPQARRW
jgi:hypothetical protein